MMSMWIPNLKMLNKKKGFTLMELITVLTVISILSAVSYTSYKGYYKRARVYSAKKDLSSIIALAETFQANTGFFLPNLREMYVPIKGKYSYNYKVICHKDGAVGNVLWKTNSIESDTCGGFEIEKKDLTPPDPPKKTLNTTNSCTHSNTKCWMGAVLCHNYSASTTVNCGGENYTLGFKNRGVLQLKSASDEDWGGSNVKKAELAPLFNIVDFAAKKEDSGNPPNNLSGDPYCKRVSRSDDLLRDSSDCFFIKEYAVNSNDVKSIIEANWGATDEEKEEFISNPQKLVVTALACKERQTDCSGLGTSVDYSIIRMDTNRLVKIVQ